MKINTQIRPGSDFPSVKPLESQRTVKETWNLPQVYKNREFYIKLKCPPTPQTLSVAVNPALNVYNLGWVATCDCVSNKNITVQFGNIMEVGQGSGPRRIRIYFWCHGNLGWAGRGGEVLHVFSCLVKLLTKTSHQTTPPAQKITKNL